MRLSVVIPCYNEIKTIDTIIDAVNASPYPDKEPLNGLIQTGSVAELTLTPS